MTLFSFMSMHGEYLISPYLRASARSHDVCAAALVAMRVHALHGGPKGLKIILWLCGIAYALTTMGLLGVGLYVRQREYKQLMVAAKSVC